jgi:hypothetical protein
MKFMNKKADVSITLLVFMIVFLSGFTLFSFAKSNLTSIARFNDVRFIEKAGYWEEGARFDLVGAGERAFIKSYSELLAQNPFAMRQEQIDGGMKNNFLMYFLSDDMIKSRYSGYVNTFAVKVDKEMLELSNSLKFGDSFAAGKGVTILSYTYPFEKKFYLQDYGLYSVDEINQASEECLKEKDILSCLALRLPNLSPQIGNNNKITFTSKRMYLIDGELKPISFSFKQA